MGEFSIEQQNANLIQNADQIIYQVGTPERNHFEVGLRALAAGYYAEARSSLAEALRDAPANAHTRYSLALSMLDGKRPHMHSINQVGVIREHLAHARELPQAEVLMALVNEDHGLHWRKGVRLPPRLAALIGSLGAAQARDITTHVPAPECAVWRALASRTSNQGTGS
jgi:hypothetical protein